jgi:hypothetical protein
MALPSVAGVSTSRATASNTLLYSYPTAPAPVAGDFMVMYVSYNHATALVVDPGPPPGWTLKAHLPGNPIALSVAIYTRWADGTEVPGDQAAVPALAVAKVARVITYKNVRPDTPFGVEPFVFEKGNGNTSTTDPTQRFPTVTTPAGFMLACSHYGAGNSAATLSGAAVTGETGGDWISQGRGGTSGTRDSQESASMRNAGTITGGTRPFTGSDTSFEYMTAAFALAGYDGDINIFSTANEDRDEVTATVDLHPIIDAEMFEVRDEVGGIVSVSGVVISGETLEAPNTAAGSATIYPVLEIASNIQEAPDTVTSSVYVLKASPFSRFQFAWPTLGIGYPLVPVANLEIALQQQPKEFIGLLVQAQNTEDVSLGSVPWVVETGIMQVAVIVESGTGFDLADAIARKIIKAYHGYISDEMDFWITRATGPTDAEPEANGERYVLRVDLEYNWQYRHPVKVKGPLPAVEEEGYMFDGFKQVIFDGVAKDIDLTDAKTMFMCTSDLPVTFTLLGNVTTPMQCAFVQMGEGVVSVTEGVGAIIVSAFDQENAEHRSTARRGAPMVAHMWRNLTSANSEWNLYGVTQSLEA